MTDDHPTLVPPFTALAPIYDRIGFADFALQAVERYVAYAQQNDWAGRRIIDLGCQTGAASWWLAQHGYRVTGVEEHAPLLNVAATRYDTRELAMGSAPEFAQNTLSALSALSGVVDLALGIDGVLHRAASLREIETALAAIYGILDTGRLLIFDLETIGGLAASAEPETVTPYDDPYDLTVIAHRRFNYETLSRSTHYIIWRRAGGAWRRADEHHVARGYPVHAIRTLLERTGFALRALLTPEMGPVDPGLEQPARVVFVAEKI